MAKKLDTLQQARLYNYVCEILEWKDGDTVVVNIDVGFDWKKKDTVRIYGMNAHEIRSKDPKERALGLRDKTFAEALAPVGSHVLIRTHKAGQDEEKFGRWLADITLRDGRDFAQIMIDSNHGIPYFGGKR